MDSRIVSQNTSLRILCQVCIPILDKRDVFTKSLRTRCVLKPLDVSVDTHQERIEALCRYAKKLHGTGALLTECDKCSILFRSFPAARKIMFIRSDKEPANCEETEIITFMKREKTISDKEDAKRRKASKEREKAVMKTRLRRKARTVGSRKAEDDVAKEVREKLIQKHCAESTRITSGKIALTISPI